MKEHGSRSVWTLDDPRPELPRLEGDLEADACVVGAGIAGLSTAYHLARAGRSVVVLDDGILGGGETERTTAHLVCAMDDRFLELERLHGEEGSRLAGQSHRAAIDRVEEIVRSESIECGFERLDGYLFLGPGDDASLLEREHAAARRAGIDCELVARAPVPGWESGPCLRFPRQGQFHPLRYLAGMAQAILRDGGRVFTRSRAESVEGTDDGRARVATAAGSVRARAVVVATNTPFVDRVVLHTKQAPYRTYAVALRLAPGAVPHALYWDTSDPYHYVRVARTGGEESLVVGGEDHKTGQAERPEERWSRLETWARERFRGLGEAVARWSGQVMEPADALAFIGRNPGDEHVYVATGDSGQGMTHGTIAGMLLTDLVLGRENPWAKLYDPARKSLRLRAAWELARENLNVAVQYLDHVTSGDVGSAEEVRPGSGAVLRRGLRQVAVYRDEQGVAHERSALCPHLGCIVAWNPAERSWDCPCHGSRFDPLGRVLNGPANRDLAPAGGEG